MNLFHNPTTTLITAGVLTASVVLGYYLLTSNKKPSLYEQLGGEPAVDAVVERFYDIMMMDDRVNHFFKNTNMNRQRAMQKKFLNHVLGGKEYNGKNMKAAHAHLKLKDADFDAVLENLSKAMSQLGVGKGFIDQVIAIAETTRNDVLGR